MNTPITEEQLTAYLLGELDDTEVQQVEAAIETDAATKALAEELKTCIELTGEVFQQEEALALTEEQRNTIEVDDFTELKEIGTAPRFWFGMFKFAIATAIILLLASVVVPNVSKYIRRGKADTELARQRSEQLARTKQLQNSNMRISQDKTNPKNAGVDPNAVTSFETISTDTTQASDESIPLTPEEVKAKVIKERLEHGKDYADLDNHAVATEIYESVLLLDPNNKEAREGLHDSVMQQKEQQIAEMETVREEVNNTVHVETEGKKKLPGNGSQNTEVALGIQGSPTTEDFYGYDMLPANPNSSLQKIEIDGKLMVRTDGNSQNRTLYERRKPLPAGADATGIKPYSVAVPKHAGERKSQDYSFIPQQAEIDGKLLAKSNSTTPDTGEWLEMELGTRSQASHSGDPAAKKKPVTWIEQRTQLGVQTDFEKLGNSSSGGRQGGYGGGGYGGGGYGGGGQGGYGGYGSGGGYGGYRANSQWHYRRDPQLQQDSYSHNTEAYASIHENEFKRVNDDPLSTFSIDVDTASYSNMRRMLNQGILPPPDAVRIEELINYFDYGYAPPEDRETPFAAHVTVAGCPWNPKHRLARVGLKGWEMPKAKRPPSNFVFLLDVSGSMSSENKLPLVKRSIRMLTKQLDERDRVAMVVYAGASGLALDSVSAHKQKKILKAIDNLEAGGSTNGGAGIELAYRVAAENFIKGGVNRVILATDGDFNVGTTDQGSLTRLIEEKAKSNIFLTVLGYGMGNLKDSTMELLADKGNGNYAYIDNVREAKKVLKEQMTGTLVTIAKDVKIQIEFNPAQIGAYRLIGYENRILAAQDFNDDTKDAGEIGAGHTVTALYELVPAGQPIHTPGIDPLKYQESAEPEVKLSDSKEAFTLKLRYKEPTGDTSKLLEFPIVDTEMKFRQADKDFKFTAAVASFGMQLRGSKYKGDAGLEQVLHWAEDGLGEDPHGYRAEFIDLVRKSQQL